MSVGDFARAWAIAVAIGVALGGCATQRTQPDPSPELQEIHSTAGHRRLPPQLEPAPAQAGQAAPTDVWERIRAQMSWSAVEHPRIAAEIAWFRTHPQFLLDTSRRAAPFLYFVVEEVERRGLPIEIALLPIVESAFKAKAYSRSHASGLWQFIPSTGRRFGLQQDWWYDERRDIVKATHAALDYLTALNVRFKGDWLLALAGYNCGELTVERAIVRNKKKPDFWSLKLSPETTKYVPQLLAIARIVADPDAYGQTLAPIANAPFFTMVDSGGPVELRRVAETAGVDVELLALLNANYRRGVGSPDGPFHIYVPVAASAEATAALAALPRDARLSFDRYVVKPGDTLSGIAARFDTTVQSLQESNGLKGHMIRAGQELIVPPAGLAVAAAEPRPARVVAQRSESDRVHTVRGGDTLWAIARAYGTRVEDLVRWNGIAANSTLRINQRIRVSAGEATIAPAASQRELSYQIRSGDSFWSISRRFSVSVADLLRWNPGSNPSSLRPGDTLRLFLGPDA
jgi:membrane-bound lytic murein transglycosylase D